MLRYLVMGSDGGRIRDEESARTVHCLKERDDERKPWLFGRQRTSVDNLVFFHTFASGRSLLLIDPVRLVPVVVRNKAELDRCVRELSNRAESAMS